MKILLAGGSGLIGQALLSRLLAEEHQVWVLSRNPGVEAHKLGRQNGLEWVGWDGKTTQGWANLAGEVDAVINLTGANIGEKRWTGERKIILRTSRTEPGQALVEAVRQAARPPSVFIQIAGVGYYGSDRTDLLDEETYAGSDFLAKLAADWEKVTTPVADLGVRHVILRSGVVLTREGGVLAPFVLQNRLFVGGPLGSGKQWISWIHIEDLVDCFLFVLNQAEARGVFNSTSPHPVTNADFGKAVGKVMKRPYWAPVPSFMLRLLLGEMSTLVLDGQKVYPRRLLDLGFKFRFGELRPALENLLQKKPV